MNKPNSLIIGAAGGVGLQVTRQLAAAGHRVFGTVLNDAEATLVRAEVPDIELALLDLSNADGIAAGLQPLLQKLEQQLDHVVVCAAISPYGPLETTPLASLRRTLEINTLANLAVYQTCIPLLRAAKGRLLLISSFAGKVALPFIGHYSTSKFALEGLADVMRREAARWGVRIIIVEPGGIRTGMVSGQLASIGGDRAKLSPEARALYGADYENFEAVLQQANAAAMEPARVATAIVAALQADEPQTRYQIGDDAQYLCDVAARLPDLELDAIATGFLSGGKAS